MKVLTNLALLLMFSTSAVLADEVNISNISIPPEATTGWVGSDINHNGLAMAIKTFSSPEPLESVLVFYRNQWAREGDFPGFVENKLGDWSVISKISQEHNVVLQIKSNNGNETTGFLSSMKLTPNKLFGRKDVLIPDNTKEVSHTLSNDYGKTGFTSILISGSSVGSVAGFYRDRLKRKQWNLVSDERIDDTVVLKFNRNESTYDIAVNRADDGSSIIVLNRTKING